MADEPSPPVALLSEALATSLLQHTEQWGTQHGLATVSPGEYAAVITTMVTLFGGAMLASVVARLEMTQRVDVIKGLVSQLQDPLYYSVLQALAHAQRANPFLDL